MKKRLLAITHDYGLTGAPAGFFRLLTELRGNYDITVASGGAGALHDEYEKHGFHTCLAHPPILQTMECSDEYVKSADVVLANTVLSAIPVLSAIAYRKPVVWSIHETEEYMDRLTGPLHLAMESAPVIVATCDAAVAMYSAIHPRKYEVIRPGVPLPPDGLTKIDYRSGPLRTICLGTIRPGKGQHRAINAIRECALETATLTIAGMVADADYLGKCRALSEGWPVTFITDLAWGTQYNLLAQHDILILSSEEEMFPQVIAERKCSACASWPAEWGESRKPSRSLRRDTYSTPPGNLRFFFKDCGRSRSK